MATLEQTQGCLLGLSLGDACGAPFEGGFVERCLWRAIGLTRRGEMRWTDDTQMSVDVVESFLATRKIDPDDLAIRFSKSYHWSRGYGPGAAKVLRQIAAGADWRDANCSVYPNGSFGNGAAMRAPMIGVIYADRPATLIEAARLSAIVTHAHPLALEGAVFIAAVTASAYRGDRSADVLDAGMSSVSQVEFTSRLEVARAWLESGQDVSTKDVVRQLGNGIEARESCVTAVYLALRFRDRPFMEMQQFIASCRGDVDTIGAMAGAIWGAASGSAKLPLQWLKRLEHRERLCELAANLHRTLGDPQEESTSIEGPYQGPFPMDCLLRFTGAKQRDPAIEAWLKKQPAELGAVARQWFAEFRGCGDDVRELMHDGCPVACVEDVPFGYVNVFKAHVNVGFFFGADLQDPAGLLEGTGKRMRHVKLKPGRALDEAALQALVDAAYRDVCARL